jgi:hypothetical protein
MIRIPGFHTGRQLNVTLCGTTPVLKLCVTRAAADIRRTTHSWQLTMHNTWCSFLSTMRCLRASQHGICVQLPGWQRPMLCLDALLLDDSAAHSLLSRLCVFATRD